MTETQFGKLSANLRSRSGKGVARKLRSQGLIPAVMYGKGQGNTMLTISPRDLRRALDPERKLNTFFSIEIEDGGKTVVERCVLTDYQADPIRDEFVHVDFLRVDPDSEVVAKIPVEYVGRAAGVALGGKLRTYQRTTRVAAKPADIPIKLTVDVSSLMEGDAVRVRDLKLDNARLLDHPNVVVAQVDAPRAESEDAEAAPGEDAEAETKTKTKTED